MNERITENIVRKKFRQLGYYKNPDVKVEEQKSENPKIDGVVKSPN